MPDFRWIDGASFEDEWRDWLENPPLNWSPPEGATIIWTNTYDSRTQRDPNIDGWFYVTRLDAWPSKAGLSMHFRQVFVFAVPDKDDPEVLRAHYRSTVTSYVIAWKELGHLREWLIDPSNPKKPNGKGKKNNWDDKL